MNVVCLDGVGNEAYLSTLLHLFYLRIYLL